MDQMQTETKPALMQETDFQTRKALLQKKTDENMRDQEEIWTGEEIKSFFISHS